MKPIFNWILSATFLDLAPSCHQQLEATTSAWLCSWLYSPGMFSDTFRSLSSRIHWQLCVIPSITSSAGHWALAHEATMMPLFFPVLLEWTHAHWPNLILVGWFLYPHACPYMGGPLVLLYPMLVSWLWPPIWLPIRDPHCPLWCWGQSQPI